MAGLNPVTRWRAQAGAHRIASWITAMSLLWLASIPAAVGAEGRPAGMGNVMGTASPDDTAAQSNPSPSAAAVLQGEVVSEVSEATADTRVIVAQYESADWVAQVKVTGVHGIVDSALSEPGMVALQGYVYAAEAQNIWKGQAGSLVAFRVALSACDSKLRLGEQYLLFARSDSSGHLQVASCEAIISRHDAANVLAFLAREGQG